MNQAPVNTKSGMTFASGLRALLRQDPNIIMVGEIRDGETADLAVQAVLTGHVVLSTLHTNNAATTLPRLLDMGVEPFLISSTVNSVIGQRLVRRLCPVCRIAYVPEGVELNNVKRDFQLDAAIKRFNELKGTQTAAPEQPATSVSTPNPSAQEEPILPTEHKKGRVINPDTTLIPQRALSIRLQPTRTSSTAVLLTLIKNRSKCGPPITITPTAVAETAPPLQPTNVQKAPDPEGLKSSNSFYISRVQVVKTAVAVATRAGWVYMRFLRSQIIFKK